MKKTIWILIALIIIVIIAVAFKTAGNLKNPKDDTASTSTPKKITEDGIIRFMCDGGKTFKVQFADIVNLPVPDKDSDEGDSIGANVTFDADTEVMFLTQSKSSSHEYENSDKTITFYVEGDEASAVKNGVKYDNCQAAK